MTDGEFLPTSKLSKYLSELVCSPRLKLIEGLCGDVLFLLCGFDPDSTNFNQVCVCACVLWRYCFLNEYLFIYLNVFCWSKKVLFFVSISLKCF